MVGKLNFKLTKIPYIPDTKRVDDFKSHVLQIHLKIEARIDDFIASTLSGENFMDIFREILLDSRNIGFKSKSDIILRILKKYQNELKLVYNITSDKNNPDKIIFSYSKKSFKPSDLHRNLCSINKIRNHIVHKITIDPATVSKSSKYNAYRFGDKRKLMKCYNYCISTFYNFEKSMIKS